MNTFIIKTITETAIAAGLPADKVMEISEADGLTLPRPRLEYKFLPEVLTRSGKKLAVTREGNTQTTKREAYIVKQDVLVNLFAPVEDAENWLAQFCRTFVAALPRGGNDTAGNWVVVRASKATQSRPLVKRVGTSEIRVMERLSTLYQIQFTGRITVDETVSLIPDAIINPPNFRGKDA